LGVAACLGATPAIKLIPSSVLWGYFAFMAIESLGGMQFWERLLLLGTDPSRWVVHPPTCYLLPGGACMLRVGGQGHGGVGRVGAGFGAL